LKKYYKLNEYQKVAMNVLYPFKDKCRQLEYAVLALCGEAGELANTLKHIEYYKDTSYNGTNIIDELSDILWYVACVADSLNIKLSEVATFSIEKVLARQTTKNRMETEARMKEVN